MLYANPPGPAPATPNVGGVSQNWVVVSRTAGSGKDLRVRLLLISCLVVPGVVAGLANLFQFSVGILPVILATIALVAGSQLGWNEIYEYGSFGVKSLVILAGFAAFLWVIAMMHAPRSTVLSLIGEEVRARVVGHEIFRYDDGDDWDFEHCYTVRRIDNGMVAGGMCRNYGEYRLRDGVTVLMDPYGLMAETPEEVADARPWQVMGLVSLPLVVVPAWLTGGASIRPRRRSRLP